MSVYLLVWSCVCLSVCVSDFIYYLLFMYLFAINLLCYCDFKRRGINRMKVLMLEMVVVVVVLCLSMVCLSVCLFL